MLSPSAANILIKTTEMCI